MGQVCGRGKGPSKKAIAERARRVEILSLLHFIDGHRVTIDDHLRTVESKDAVFELEKLRVRVCDGYKTGTLGPLEERFKHRKTRRGDAGEARAECDRLLKSVSTVTPLEIEHFHGAVLCMETYRRLITAKSKDLALLRRRRSKMNESFAEQIAKLQAEVEVAERGHWCREQIQRWEPERNPAYRRKVLAVDGGPPSPAGLNSPLVRMVDSAYVLPGEAPANASGGTRLQTSF